MELSVLLFLTSGLFLGWSLGANDAANVFGTAVGTRMVRFATAAVVCSVFVILGAVISGSGAAHTLGQLGSVNAIAGSFMVALAAGVSVYLMTKWGLPVSTSQAIVGAIIGWNLFTESVTDSETLLKIVATWIACPVLAGFFAIVLMKFVKVFLHVIKLHLLRLDAYTRFALIFAGAFGSYSLGANNIANVMGVFVDVSPFTDFQIAGLFALSSVEQLFLLGAIAIAVGVFTYSKRVMLTVGAGLMPMSPVAAWVVVIAHSIVLFVFASEGLEHLLAGAGLPTIPLVPVSSSQAVVGGVIGLGLMRGGKDIDWKLVGNIGLGWITTPIM
ncbi:MAG TPA: inorganic phosphate transporter, partial [Gammaproteobacteria bacterium]|nr:inorganic phosphate transporter [Gammaproteobacteria bacterium]